jgi:hypothetical protein
MPFIPALLLACLGAALLAPVATSLIIASAPLPALTEKEERWADGASSVTVKSPMWAKFDKIEFYVTNAPQPYDHDNKPATRNRYRVIPNSVSNVAPTLVNDFPLIPGAQHWEGTAQLNLAGLTQDQWVVVLVRGTDNVPAAAFPVLPTRWSGRRVRTIRAGRAARTPTARARGTCTVTNQSLAELTDGNLNQCGVLTLAFSNPLFIDVNQNNQYDPLGVILTP